MKQFWAFLLALSLLTILVFCTLSMLGFVDTEMISDCFENITLFRPVEETVPPTSPTPPVPMPPVDYQEPAVPVAETEYTISPYGTVTANVLNIRKGPGTDYDIIGKYYEGDIVRLIGASNGWGKTDRGWISLDYVTLEDPAIIKALGYTYVPPLNNNDSGSTVTPPSSGNQGTNTLPPSDGNTAIFGDWYCVWKDTNGDVYIASYSFNTNGLCGTGMERYPHDPNYITGAEYLYATVGSTIYFLEYQLDNNPDLSSSTFSVNGDVLTLGKATFFRGSAEDANAEAEKMLSSGTTTPPATDNTNQLPPSDGNTALLGQWYAIVNYGYTYSIGVYTFSANECGVELWSIDPNNPDTVFVDGADSFIYSTVGNILYSQPSGDPYNPPEAYPVSSDSFYIEGDTFVWGSSTFYRGGYDLAVAAVKDLLSSN